MELPQIDLIEPPKNLAATDYLPPLRYESLPTPTSIRLLKIDHLPSLKDDLDLFRSITCSLVVKDLNDRPKYDALSYTWGDPLGRESSNENPTAPGGWATTPFCIICNDQRVNISTNLHTALIAIRYHHMKMQENPPSIRPWPYMSEYIWVDQICINQADISEKNSQVQLMGRIYRQCVISQIWLGGYHQDVKDLLHTMTSLAPLNWIPDGMFRSFNILDPQVCKVLGIKPITRERVRGTLDFFNRAWFKRSWIIQETVLALQSNALLGRAYIPFQALARFMTFLGKTGWFDRVVIAGHRQYPGRPATLSFFRSLEDVGHRLGTIKLHPDDQYWKRPLPMNSITEMFGSSQATDPRDKIYAFIGITENDENQKGPQLLPDYSKSVDDVYIDATKLIMSSKGFNLECFSQKEYETLREIKSLPSWVPDFSVTPGHSPLAAQGYMWSAAPRALANSINYLPSNYIQLRGARVDTVSRWKGSVVTERVYNTGTNDALKMCGIVHISANDVVELMALVPEISAIGPPSSDPLLKGEYRERRGSPFIKHPTEIAAGAEQTIRYQSRAEVLWRTLLADIANCRHPAEDECCDKIFEELEGAIYVTMSHLISSETLNSMRMEEWKVHTNEMKEFTNLQILKGALPYNTTDTKNPKPFARVRSVILSHKKRPVYERLWQKFTTYRSELETFAERIFSADIPRSCLRNIMGKTSRGRGLFATANGHLGWGLLSTREGDEVWILEGCQVPCLLRHMGDGRYKLVGEAYVHGIMHGEALGGWMSRT